MCPVLYCIPRHLLFVTGYEDICFDPVKPSSVSSSDLYHNCLFKSWLKISNLNYNYFNHSALRAITRTRLQKSVFIGWTYKDFVAFISNGGTALGIKEGRIKKRYFPLENCFTLNFNPYINISSFLSCKPHRINFFPCNYYLKMSEKTWISFVQLSGIMLSKIMESSK